jgi:hypothetical protein
MSMLTPTLEILKMAYWKSSNIMENSSPIVFCYRIPMSSKRLTGISSREQLDHTQ